MFVVFVCIITKSMFDLMVSNKEVITVCYYTINVLYYILVEYKLKWSYDSYDYFYYFRLLIVWMMMVSLWVKGKERED